MNGNGRITVFVLNVSSSLEGKWYDRDDDGVKENILSIGISKQSIKKRIMKAHTVNTAIVTVKRINHFELR